MERYPKEQRSVILSEHVLERGVSISELSRKHQVSAHSIYNRRKAMKRAENEPVSLEPGELLGEIERLKKENSLLKNTVAEQALDIATLKQWKNFVKNKLREKSLRRKDK